MKINSYDRIIQRLDDQIDKQAHKIAQMQGPRFETLLLEMGRYRQMRAERDHWESQSQRNERQTDAGFEEMDDAEAEAPPQQSTPARRRPARGWGER